MMGSTCGAILSRKLPHTAFWTLAAILFPASRVSDFQFAFLFPFPLEVHRLSRLRSPCRVSVFVLRRAETGQKSLSMHYQHVRSLLMEERGDPGKRELMAAIAWVRCEGKSRRQTLSRLRAPERIQRSQTDTQAIAAEIRPGPSEFLEDAYVYDNKVESWLILIADDDTEACSQIINSLSQSSPSTRVARTDHRGITSFYSRWFPHNN